MKTIGGIISNVTNLYREINPSRLSGAIDVIVIQQPDGTFKSSPFYVKFGILDVLKAGDQKVELYVNDQLVDLQMTLGKSGHAYFSFIAGPCNCHACRLVKSDISADNKPATSSSNLNLSHLKANQNLVLSDSELFNKTDSKNNDAHSSDVDLPQLKQLYEKEFVKTPETPDLNETPPKLFSVSFEDENYTDNIKDLNEISLLPKPALPDFQVKLSLCGKFSSCSKKPDKFDDFIVKFEDFIANPGLLQNTNLVVNINQSYYNWQIAAPIIVSYVAFNSFLPKDTLLNLKREHIPRKSKGWFYWKKTLEAEISEEESKNDTKSDFGGQMKYGLGGNIDSDEPLESPNDPGNPMIDIPKTVSNETQRSVFIYQQCQRMAKTLPSEFFPALNLNPGENTVLFSVTTRVQGTVTCSAKIFLWNYQDRLVVSDVDGTITRSDVLGMMLPIIGKDWTHGGVSKLFSLIRNNGYKIMYLSARTIGIANQTRTYLEDLILDTHKLPRGPILLSPSSLIEALHREVVLKTPEVFKIDCLNNIKDLFPPLSQPLVSGFGNRVNDYQAYLAVGIPQSKIFIINEKGQIRQKMSTSYLSSYSTMAEFVDLIFPLLDNQKPCQFHLNEFNDFFYWRRYQQCNE